jgi:hypothetical protein
LLTGKGKNLVTLFDDADHDDRGNMSSTWLGMAFL